MDGMHGLLIFHCSDFNALLAWFCASSGMLSSKSSVESYLHRVFWYRMFARSRHAMGQGLRVRLSTLRLIGQHLQFRCPGGILLTLFQYLGKSLEEKDKKTSTLLIGNGDVHIMNINEHVALLRRFPTIRGTEKGFFRWFEIDPILDDSETICQHTREQYQCMFQNLACHSCIWWPHRLLGFWWNVGPAISTEKGRIGFSQLFNKLDDHPMIPFLEY